MRPHWASARRPEREPDRAIRGARISRRTERESAPLPLYLESPVKTSRKGQGRGSGQGVRDRP